MPVDLNNLIGAGSIGANYKTVHSQAEANALNAQGYQLAPGGATEKADGSGSWTLYQMGPSATKITRSLLGNYVDAYNTADSDFSALGMSASRDINEGAQRASASLTQSAMSRGLSNNSAIMSLQRGVEVDRARSQIALNDSLRRQALDYKNSYLDKIGDLSLSLSQLNQNTEQPGQYIAPEPAAPRDNFGKKLAKAFGIRIP